MKLNYKILWLDDRMQTILDDGYKEDLDDFITELGFQSEIITVKNETDFFKILDDSFDLIMTDYHLNDTGPETRNGNVIVEETRKRSIYTEIMFYSAQGSVVDTTKLSRITFVDTSRSTNIIHNETIVDEAKKLIKLTVRKFEHIITMRGMIMHETSELDVIMNDLLIRIIDQAEDSSKVIKIIKDKYISSTTKSIKKLRTMTDNNEILYVIGSSHRWRAIKRNIKSGAIKDTLNDYEKDIITPRNQFAHAILDPSTNTFRTKKGILFNNKKCKELRIAIIKHKENLTKLKDQLSE